MRIYLFLLLIFTCVVPPVYAASAIPHPVTEAPNSQQLSRKEKKKIERWEKWKAKWAAKAKKKERKSKYGRIGLFVLLGGVVLLVLSEVFFILGLIGAIYFGGMGISKDENKTAAIIAAALPLAFLVIVFIQLAGIFGAG